MIPGPARLEQDFLARAIGSPVMKRIGFTLIELLVVVAIISLLISILLPSLREAKELARRSVCAGNLRNINIGIHGYATENDGMGPAFRTDGSDCPSPGYSSLSDWANLFVGGNEEDGRWRGGNIRTETPGRRKLRDYGTAEMYLCPSDIGVIPGDSEGYRWYDWVGTSYFYNACWYGVGGNPGWAYTQQSPWVLGGRAFEEFSEPARQVMTGDAAIFYTWPYWYAYALGPHGVEFPWHDPPYKNSATEIQDGICFYDMKCNVGFLDSHVEFLALGPYDPGDLTMNRGAYIIDPDYNP